jgi:lipoprotein-anchoring transpeptidase ErfK/SrfK
LLWVRRTSSNFRDEVSVKMRSAAGRAAEGLIDSCTLSGVSRLALGAGFTVLFATIAAPAHAQFGFSWFGMQPAPVMRAAPMERYMRRVRPRAGPSLGTLKSAIKAQAKHDAVQKPIVGPVMIMVSVNRQRLTVYDGDRAIVSAPVSTGMKGHETPLGVFTVIQKELLHHSNLYSNAPMPYMQRITWSGVALHAGPLPGHAASHGCIRLPRDFAVRLYGMTKIGARVIVARNELSPAAFSDARLFTMRDPTAAPSASTSPGQGAAADPADTANRPRAAGQVASLATVPVPQTRADAAGVQYAMSTQLPSAYDEVAPTVQELAAAAALDRLRQATNAGQTALAPDAKPDAPAPDAAAKPKKTGPISIFVSRKEGKLFVRRAFEPIYQAPIAIDGAEALGTHVYTATNEPADGTALHWVSVSIASAIADPPRMRKGPVEGRSVKVATPVPQPVVVPGSTASEALERVQLTPETRDRIAELITPGSSLIISDKGLGSETGRGTDFIVLTH